MQEATERQEFREQDERDDSWADFEIIQGGMGFGVSNYEMAGEVAKKGELGVISAVGSGMLLVRGLQDGGERANHTLEVLKDFPDQELVTSIVNKYYNPEGRGINTRTGGPNKYIKPVMLGYSVLDGVDREAEELNMVGAYAEVAMAKEVANGKGKIGMNLLEKIQEPTMSALYGAMIAGVDTVIMGAGIPRYIPQILDDLAINEKVEYPLDVSGATVEEKKSGYFNMPFDPTISYPSIVENLEAQGVALQRPKFLAIVTADSLAKRLLRSTTVPPDGFIVELPIAGGHNAPPRNKNARNEKGESVYGEKDEPNFQKMEELDVPFWIAGGYGNPEGLKEAKDRGAKGIQVGSAFALSVESGIHYDTKQELIRMIISESGVDVRTDPLASPTGFPFKILMKPGTLAEAKIYADRTRICDLGYLREKVRHVNEEGAVDIMYRCPSEPQKIYVSKGGAEEDTVGRMCLCNGLAATIGMPQVKSRGMEEPEVLTGGDSINADVRRIHSYLGRIAGESKEDFTSSTVVDYLRSG